MFLISLSPDKWSDLHHIGAIVRRGGLRHHPVLGRNSIVGGHISIPDWIGV